jgi:hypothetical protein
MMIKQATATKRRWLRAPEAVRYLAEKFGQPVVTEAGLRTWVAQRRIPVVRIGGSVFIDTASLDAMISEVPAER